MTSVSAASALALWKVRKDQFKESIRAEFLSHFGLDIDNFWNSTVGCIDLVKMIDEVLERPDGVSPLQQMEQKFGTEAVLWYVTTQEAAFAIKYVPSSVLQLWLIRTQYSWR